MHIALRVVLAVSALSAAGAAAAGRCEPWPSWERFAASYVSADGRVIDTSTERRITTSEGQSYALFFALVGNDRQRFARVLEWTQNNLAGGDLRRALPAWQWGRADDGSWRVLDPNAASDSDLWIAYALAEAGRLWHEPAYTSLARALAKRILREEVTAVPALGATLLPGPRGFVENGRWRLNASYLPMPVLRRMPAISGDALWGEVIRSSERVILESAPRGFAADWIEYDARAGFVADRTTGAVGSYNAIRVYLWVGAAPADPSFAALHRRLQPMIEHARTRAAPAAEIDTRTLEMKGEGPPGFSAALLPLLAAVDAHDALRSHRERVEQHSLKDAAAYYGDALAVFGLGALDGWYRFERDGRLQVKWPRSCARAR